MRMTLSRWSELRSTSSLPFVLVFLLAPIPAEANCPGPGCPSGISRTAPTQSAKPRFSKKVPLKSTSRKHAPRKLSHFDETAALSIYKKMPVWLAKPEYWAFLGEPTRIRILQASLKLEGYYDGKVDGRIGQLTRRAVENYQKSEGERVTGNLNRFQKTRLRSQFWAKVSEMEPDDSVILQLFDGVESERPKVLIDSGIAVFR